MIHNRHGYKCSSSKLITTPYLVHVIATMSVQNAGLDIRMVYFVVECLLVVRGVVGSISPLDLYLVLASAPRLE